MTTFARAPHGEHNGEPVDWPALKRQILEKLDVVGEYTALGVRFTATNTRSTGWRECRAYGREDKKPSAAVNVLTGVYKADGDQAEVLGFFDFAARHGNLGSWIETLEHYAAKAGVPLPYAPKHGDKGRIEAVYPYRDAEGEVVYEVVRYIRDDGTKTFRQRRPDGKGGHHPNIDGVTPVPYNLPEIVAGGEDDSIFITEGEKDADRLTAECLTATTNHGGSGNTKVWEKLAPHFAGRDVTILLDNDAAGLKHGHGVAAFLHPVARSVRVVALPGLPIRGDVSDWLDAGNTIEELGRLAYAAPLWEPGSVEDVNRDATVADLRKAMSATAWIWRSWIPNAALTLLASEAGTGKTRFGFDLHRRIHHGLVWPDGSPMTAVVGGKALWVVADNQHQEMCDLCRDFGIPDEAVVINSTAADPYGGTNLQTADDLADFEARIRRVEPVLVIIDTITNTGDFKAQDSFDAKRQYKPLQEIAVRCQVPILCVTHLNAGGKVLGRRAVEKVRVVIQMDHPDPEGQPNRRKLWVSKSKAVKPAPLGVSMGDKSNDYDLDPPQAPPDEGQARQEPAGGKALTWLVKYLGNGPARIGHVISAAERDGIAKATLYRAVRALEVEKIEADDGKYWRLVHQ